MYEEMMTNNDNVESSLLTSIYSIYVICTSRVLLQVAHVELYSSRVVSSMLCVVELIRYAEHIAIYRTIVYCQLTGSIMECSLRVTSAGVAG